MRARRFPFDPALPRRQPDGGPHEKEHDEHRLEEQPDALAKAKDKVWASMTAAEKQAVTCLGWDRTSWDEGDDLAFSACEWVDLSQPQQAAARVLGFAPSDFTNERTP